MDVRELLEGVKNQSVNIEEAEQYLKELPYQNLGFCRLDHHRALRNGFGEVIYCEGKATEHLVTNLPKLSGQERKRARDEGVTGTVPSGKGGCAGSFV